MIFSTGKKTIKHTVFKYFLLSTACSVLLLVLFAYVISVRIVTEKVRLSFEETTSFISNSLNGEIVYINRMMNFFFIDSDIKKIVDVPEITPYNFLQSVENIEARIRNNLLINFFDYVREIKIFSPSKEVYTFNDDSQKPHMDGQAILASQDFATVFSSQGKPVFTAGKKHYVRTEMQNAKESPVIIFRVIKDTLFRRNIGAVAVYINTDIFDRHLTNYTFVKNNAFALLTEDFIPVTGNGSALSPHIIKKIQARTFDGKTQFSFSELGKLIFCSVIPENGWITVGILPVSSLIKDNLPILLLGLAAIMLSASIFLLLWAKLDRRILTPLNTVSDSLKNLHNGRAESAVIPAKSASEIIRLIENYNFMISRLDELISENIRKEVAQKEAEYAALQAQINPHFLYNTLNSIRWMAIIRQADNIKTVVETLVRLLRNTTKPPEEITTLAQELDNVRDYVFIQQLAAQFNFTVEYDVAEETLNVPCVKFLLQPLVENAIFHGLGKKDGGGYVKISTYITEFSGTPIAEISVFDDGEGFPGGVLEKKQFNGIGIANVSRRLTLTYGETFDLNIRSKPGEYTEVLIRIPLPEEKGEQI